MRLPAARIRALSRLQETAIENGAVGGDDEHDLFQQIVDGSKSVIRTLAVRIGPAGVNGGGKLGHMPAAEWGVQRGVF